MKLSELEKQVEQMELDVYDTPGCYKVARILQTHARDTLWAILDYFGLAYSNPGEPEAESEDRSIVIPLTSCDAGNNGGMLTSEEEESTLADKFELPSDLYYARLRVQQTKDILENDWQFGLVYPEEME